MCQDLNLVAAVEYVWPALNKCHYSAHTHQHGQHNAPNMADRIKRHANDGGKKKASNHLDASGIPITWRVMTVEG